MQRLSQNDTIVGQFKENINDGIIQQLTNGKTKPIRQIELKYIKFYDEKNAFVKLDVEVPMESSNATFTSIWLEELISGDVKLYKRYYYINNNNMGMQHQHMNSFSGPNPNSYDNITVSSRGSYVYIIRIKNDYPEVVEQSLFSFDKKSISKIFADYPDALLAIDKHFKKSSSLENLIKMLNTDDGKKLLNNKVVSTEE